MVPLIEEQLHQYLIDEEEKRCRALEEKARKEGDHSVKIKRKKVEKPWKRIGPNALCQEPELLLMVNQYDYDLADKDFQKYCENRGILFIAGDFGSKRWHIFMHWNKSKDDYLADPYFQYAEEVNGKKYKYNNHEMDVQWRIIKLGRAKLQDCWELYSKRPEH
jgi:hypothetical protein